MRLGIAGLWTLHRTVLVACIMVYLHGVELIHMLGEHSKGLSYVLGESVFISQPEVVQVNATAVRIRFSVTGTGDNPTFVRCITWKPTIGLGVPTVQQVLAGVKSNGNHADSAPPGEYFPQLNLVHVNLIGLQSATLYRGYCATSNQVSNAFTSNTSGFLSQPRLLQVTRSSLATEVVTTTDATISCVAFNASEYTPITTVTNFASVCISKAAFCSRIETKAHVPQKLIISGVSAASLLTVQCAIPQQTLTSPQNISTSGFLESPKLMSMRLDELTKGELVSIRLEVVSSQTEVVTCNIVSDSGVSLMASALAVSGLKQEIQFSDLRRIAYTFTCTTSFGIESNSRSFNLLCPQEQKAPQDTNSAEVTSTKFSDLRYSVASTIEFQGVAASTLFDVQNSNMLRNVLAKLLSMDPQDVMIAGGLTTQANNSNGVSAKLTVAAFHMNEKKADASLRVFELAVNCSSTATIMQDAISNGFKHIKVLENSPVVRFPTQPSKKTLPTIDTLALILISIAAWAACSSKEGNLHVFTLNQRLLNPIRVKRPDAASAKRK